VKSHQGIQEQQPRPQPPDCLQEPGAVRTAIEPQYRRRDHVDVDSGEIKTAMPGHSRDTLAHDQKRVLGQVDQNRTRFRHGILAQARRARGDAEGHVQSQPRLGALGGPANHADRPGAPELFHQPSLGARLAGYLSHAHHRKHLIGTHRHRHTFTFFLSAGRECLG